MSQPQNEVAVQSTGKAGLAGSRESLIYGVAKGDLYLSRPRHPKVFRTPPSGADVMTV